MFLYEPAIVSTVERSTFAEQRSGVQGAATALSVTYGIVRTPLPPLRHPARLQLLTGLMQQQSIPIVLKDYSLKPQVPLGPPETSMGTGVSALTHLWVIPIHASLWWSKKNILNLSTRA